MPSAFSPLLRLELPAVGEQDNTWGDTLNTNLGPLLDQAIAGALVVDLASGDKTLQVQNGAIDEARNVMLLCVGALAAARTITIPPTSKLYVVRNSTTGGVGVNIKTSTGNVVTVPSGQAYLIACDGINVFAAGATGGVTSYNSRTGSVSFQAGDFTAAFGFTPARIDSPAFTGTPTAPTPTGSDDSTRIATTSFVRSLIASTTAGVSTFNGRSGAVVLTNSDVVNALGYTPQSTAISINSGTGLTGGGDLSASRTLSVVPDSTVQRIEVSVGGTPIGTKKKLNFIAGANASIAANDNSAANQIDITVTATGGGAAGVTSYNGRTGAVMPQTSDVVSALGYTPFSSAGGVISGNVSVSGTLSAANMTATSDRRLKKAIQAIDRQNCDAFINSVEGMQYVKDGQEELGLIAQDVGIYFPQLVKEDAQRFLGLNYNGLVAVHQQVLRGLLERVHTLEAKLL